MPQIFSPQADKWFQLGLVLVLAGLVGLGVLAWRLAYSDHLWAVGRPAEQPIPFNHALHAGGIGLDCRYCHATVARAAGAGMPTAELCLGCHSEIWTGAAALAPLRDSVALGLPIVWASVHRLPGHVRFHHAAHVSRGVACETCHGQVWNMEQTVKVERMNMGWCLDCHRNPEPALRPVEAVLDRNWPEGAGAGSGTDPHHSIRRDGLLTDCSTCHR